MLECVPKHADMYLKSIYMERFFTALMWGRERKMEEDKTKAFLCLLKPQVPSPPTQELHNGQEEPMPLSCRQCKNNSLSQTANSTPHEWRQCREQLTLCSHIAPSVQKCGYSSSQNLCANAKAPV